MNQNIRSEDLSVVDLFKDFYEVPDYQREYVWTVENVEQLLTDVNEEFSSAATRESSDYFLGSIVVCPQNNGTLQLIDGQQRMTTCYLILCAIRDRLRELEPSAKRTTLDGQIASSSVDAKGQDVFRYRVTLQYDDSKGLLEDIAAGEPPGERESTISVSNILSAFDTIRSFLTQEFQNSADDLRLFYAFFTQRVKMIRIRTESISHALRVFETINDRGVGLNSMDLLKNLLFMSAPPESFPKLKAIWKGISDTLYRAGEKPLRFLRYFIFAEYDAEKLQEEEIYEWLVRHEDQCGYAKNPVGFASALETAALAYSRLLEGQDPTGHANRYIANIRWMSGSARQHLILLLAGRRLPHAVFVELCRHVENLFFVYVITKQPTRDFERRFVTWASAVRAISTREDLEQFVSREFQPAKASLSPRFELAFTNLSEHAVQKYRLRYVLAKLAQLVDERAWGTSSAASDLGNYLNAKVGVEHVLPQHPPAAIIDEFGGPDAWRENVSRLGNLTLIEKTINSSIGTGAFADKKAAYQLSTFLLTKSLSALPALGKDTAINRAVELLEGFETWTPANVERRQAMLARLAFHVWEVPCSQLSA